MSTKTRKLRQTAAQAKQHVINQQASGLTPKQYCELNQINRSTFSNWCAKQKQHSETDKAPASHRQNAQTAGDCWLQLPAPSQSHSQQTSPAHTLKGTSITLTLPGGAVLEIKAN